MAISIIQCARDLNINCSRTNFPTPATTTGTSGTPSPPSNASPSPPTSARNCPPPASPASNRSFARWTGSPLLKSPSSKKWSNLPSDPKHREKQSIHTKRKINKKYSSSPWGKWGRKCSTHWWWLTIRAICLWICCRKCQRQRKTWACLGEGCSHASAKSWSKARHPRV